jgi:hypothetical protein
VYLTCVSGVAWQSDGCTATGGNSGRFSRLERYIDWIRHTMGSSQVTPEFPGSEYNPKTPLERD